MTIKIDGYFDRNFGDDYMIKTVVEHFKEVNFTIADSDGVSEMLTRLGNVKISDEKTEKTLRVIGSGFMINHLKAFLFELLWVIKDKKEPAWCIGCNIEPFKNPLCKAIIRKKLNKYSLITCRDRESYEWLKKNCKKVRVEYFPDIVFAANIKKPDTAGDKLGISVMNVGFDKRYEGYYEALAKSADYYVENTGKEVYLLAFDAGKEKDEEACRYVAKLMKQKATIVVHGSENEIINAYSKCGKIIGTRFHSAVLALKMGIDLYPVIYRNKMRALLTDVGFENTASHVEAMEWNEIKRFLDDENERFLSSEEYIKKAKGHFDTLREFL